MDAESRAQRSTMDAATRLARKIADLQAQIRQIRSQGLVIPTVDADPAVDDPTVLWRFEDGRLRVRRGDGGVDEFRPVGYAGGSGGASGTPAPADPKTTKHALEQAVTWSRTICPVHGVEAGGDLYYGRYSSTHGERRIMLGLDHAAIQAALAGSVIREVWLRMRNVHSYSGSGVEVTWGAHAKGSAPGSYSSVRERVFTDRWPKSGFGKDWRRAPSWFGEALRDDTIRGLTINQPSESIDRYGAMDPGSVQIRIVYTKTV